mmetsp:Transcript_79631/g.257951  ORF Transcript_79631/g.257951 Transcript_79631/m.257951 type:complete len:522 (-) Transcript_79631:86-1651(-)
MHIALPRPWATACPAPGTARTGRRARAPRWAACCAAAASPAAAYWCHSDVYLGPVAQAESKGLALDDTTFRHCPGKVPEIWPNALDLVSHLRIFKAWEPGWPESARAGTWRRIADFAAINGARVLVGTQVTCTPEADEQDWQWTKELLALLGPEQVMGVAVGNEMELLFSKGGVDHAVTEECIEEVWGGGRFWRMFSRRVAELDAMGFGDVQVTSVFGGLALNGEPFLESPREALVTSFLRNASSTYGQRFTFTFNFYPYFDPTLTLDPGTTDQCSRALAVATCFESNCSIPTMAASARQKIQQLTGSSNDTFWVGETGWSAPTSSSLNTEMAKCKEWSSVETFRSFYERFLHWDMASVDGFRPPDHVFYFTARDSSNYGVPEAFGLVETCADVHCKLRGPTYIAPGEVAAIDLGWLRWACAGLVGFMCLAVCGAAAYAKRDGRRMAREQRELEARLCGSRGAPAPGGRAARGPEASASDDGSQPAAALRERKHAQASASDDGPGLAVARQAGGGGEESSV